MSIENKRRRFSDPLALAARLKHRVTIQQRVQANDDAGGAAVSWSNLAHVWAQLRSRSGGADERAFGGKLEAFSTHHMTIRYRADVTTDMRISYRGRLFNIRRVDNVDGANVILSLLLEEGVAS